MVAQAHHGLVLEREARVEIGRSGEETQSSESWSTENVVEVMQD